ncbi:hypothetical protein AB0K48_53130 [Nonomuraea sp. NPDC055795]
MMMAIAATALAIVIIGPLLFFTWGAELSGAHLRNLEVQDLANMRRIAGEIGLRLTALGEKARPAQIEEAVFGYPWHADKRRIVVRVEASTTIGDRCYTFFLPVRERSLRETLSCPEVTAGTAS